MGTYNPDTATKITASLEGSENGRHFWVTTPEGEKVPADGSEVADYAFGIDAFYRMNRKFAGTKDITPFGASLFSWFEIMKATRAVLRVDFVDDDLSLSTAGYREIYVNAGLDYWPIPEVHVIPNFGYVKNLKKGTSTEIADNMMARLTTAIYFK